MIRREIEGTDSEYDREKLQERLAKLAGGIAQINVGAATETEMKERKALVEDALHATRAAIEEGVVPGGGTALIRATAGHRGPQAHRRRGHGRRDHPPGRRAARPLHRRERRHRRRRRRQQDQEEHRSPVRLRRRERHLGRHVRRGHRRPHQGHPLRPPERRLRRRPAPDHRGPRSPSPPRRRKPAATTTRIMAAVAWAAWVGWAAWVAWATWE